MGITILVNDRTRAELFTALQPIEPPINDNFTSSLNGQNNYLQVIFEDSKSHYESTLSI